MLSSFRSFFIQLALFSIFTMGVLYFWQQYASLRFQTDLGWLLWGFFIIVTAFIHIVLVRSSEQSPRKFITNFMALSATKLFVYLMVIVIYALLKGKAALGFVILFLVLYFLYSIFEVVTLLKHFKK
ncbi:MAG: hypothetical protein Q7W13_07040 [Bacteroidia bacterium]|nr:hypothetical protein [Bacteroidia bacterium]